MVVVDQLQPYLDVDHFYHITIWRPPMVYLKTTLEIGSQIYGRWEVLV
jgi:hypothetical protein